MITCLRNSFNPIALRKAKTVYNFGLYECNRVKSSLVWVQTVRYVLSVSIHRNSWYQPLTYSPLIDRTAEHSVLSGKQTVYSASSSGIASRICRTCLYLSHKILILSLGFSGFLFFNHETGTSGRLNSTYISMSSPSCPDISLSLCVNSGVPLSIIKKMKRSVYDYKNSCLHYFLK